MRIRVNTERVCETGRRLIATDNRLSQIGHELQRAIGGLDTWAWDGVSRARAEPLLSRAGPESARLAEGLDTLDRQLLRVAEVFEREDNSAAGNLAGMLGWIGTVTAALLPQVAGVGRRDWRARHGVGCIGMGQTDMTRPGRRAFRR